VILLWNIVESYFSGYGRPYSIQVALFTGAKQDCGFPLQVEPPGYEKQHPSPYNTVVKLPIPSQPTLLHPPLATNRPTFLKTYLSYHVVVVEFDYDQVFTFLESLPD
jgi:hypothetical protein